MSSHMDAVPHGGNYDGAAGVGGGPGRDRAASAAERDADDGCHLVLRSS